MLRSSLCGLLVTLLVSGCATTVESQATMPASSESSDKATSPEDKEWKLVELRQTLELAQSRLEVARLEMDSSQAAQAVSLDQARKDVDLANRELVKFVNGDRTARIASAELDLRSTKDRAQEAADELAQIEIMYADQDLNDKTAEFVVSRGRRSAERAGARIAIQEAEFKTLTEGELPMTRMRLEHAVQAKEAALKEAERTTRIGAMNKEIALREAQQAVEKAERELAKASEDQ